MVSATAVMDSDGVGVCQCSPSCNLPRCSFSLLLTSSLLLESHSPLHYLLHEYPTLSPSHRQSHLTSQPPWEGGFNSAHFTDDDVVAQKSLMMSWTRRVRKAFSPRSLNSTSLFLSTCPRLVSPSPWILVLTLSPPILNPFLFLPWLFGFHFSLLSPSVTLSP